MFRIEQDEEEEEMKADKSVEKVDDDELDSFFEDEGDMLLKVRNWRR